MTIVRFPLRQVASILIVRERGGDGWLALASNGHGWLRSSLAEARREAKWLALNWSLPVHEIAP